MSFFSWRTVRATPRRSPSQITRQSRQRFCPALEALEDRALLNGNPIGAGFHFHFPPPPGPAVQLEVIASRSAEAGVPVSVRVIALDASNHVATGYTGTVHFTSSDTADMLPADSTLNNGKGSFQVTFEATGSDTLVATDTQTSSITGTSTTTVNPAPVATHLFVVAPRNVLAGVPERVVVEALDASNRVVPNYTGTVTLTTGNSADTLPGAYQFQASDHGKHVFTVTFAAAGTETLTATDNSTPPLTGSVAVTAVSAGVVTHLGVFTFPFATPNNPISVVVVALNANNRPVPTYTGTVHFTSSDGGATLPGDYMFQSTDLGVHVFHITFATAGQQTVTVTDTSPNSTISGTATVNVITLTVPPPFSFFSGLFGQGQGQGQGIFGSSLAGLLKHIPGLGQLQGQLQSLGSEVQGQFQSLGGELQGQFQNLFGQFQSQSQQQQQQQQQSHSQSQSQFVSVFTSVTNMGEQMQSIFESVGNRFGFHI